MNFKSDAFISYTHLDNEVLSKRHEGWVTYLHHALEKRLAMFLGKPPHIWCDPKLTRNDHLTNTLFDKLAHVAVLVSVVSPRYVQSKSALEELSAFVRAAQSQGGLRIENKLRIFKVLKTPVPLERHPPELQSVLGYEFFKIDPDTGRIRELNEIFGPEAETAFWLKLDDLAHDICDLVEKLEHPDAFPKKQEGQGVYLAETTSDLREQWETLRRDLQQHGYLIYPMRPLPCVASEIRAVVAEDLKQCQMSVMLVGRNYSTVPEGCKDSQLELQNQLAIERGKSGGFTRLLWLSPGAQVEDDRQIQFIDRLRLDPGMTEGADLLETYFEDLRTVILGKLKQSPVPAPQATLPTRNSVPKTESAQHQSLYFIHDQRDSDVASAWIGHLFGQFEVLPSVFEGDEPELREYREECLRNCDGVLIFYGTTNEVWVRLKISEVRKATGYGRTKPAPGVGILLGPPHCAAKGRFQTHEAIVIPQLDGLSPNSLQQFIAELKG